MHLQRALSAPSLGAPPLFGGLCARQGLQRRRGHRRTGCQVAASLVVDFPRLGEPVREWLAQGVPQLDGFDGNDLVRIFLPEFQRDPAGVALGGALLIAFLYWEGGIILHEMERRRDAARHGPDAPERVAPNRPKTRQQQLLYERKQGLAWLAVITALAIWCSGDRFLLNTPSPFM